PSGGGDCAMVLYNADGSRPETCGNGLRCVAKLARDRGHVTGDRFTIESDAGPCPTRVERADGRVVRARVHMGKPRVIARDVAIPLAASRPPGGTHPPGATQASGATHPSGETHPSDASHAR